MFENLDDSTFIGTPSAYGPADDAPRLLRQLADGDSQRAAEALYWIQASYFHQDLCCAASALVVPYLLELLGEERAINEELVLLLGRMACGRGEDEPGEIEATAQAVARGRDVLERLLRHPSPTMRSSAAWTLSRVPSPAAGALVEALGGEPDPRVRVVLRVALDAIAEPPPPLPSEAHPLERDAALIAEARALDDETHAAYLRFLLARRCDWFSFFEGEPWRWALESLSRLDDVRLEALLFEALRARLDGDLPLWPGDEGTSDVDAVDVIGKQLADRVFAGGVPRLPEALTDAQRWLLRNVWVGNARGVPLFHENALASQLAFADGDGPLDEPLDFDGRTRTVAEHLLESPIESGLPSVLEAVLRAQRAARGDARSFELAVALARGDLGHGSEIAEPLIAACLDVVTLELTLAYLESSELAPRVEAEPFFLLAPYTQRLEPPPDSLARLTVQRLRWDRCELEARKWFRTFPAAQRITLAAQLGNAHYWPLCDDYVALGRAILASSEPRLHALLVVPRALLEEALESATGARRAAIEDELRFRRENPTLTLSTRTLSATELELRGPHGAHLIRLALDGLRSFADLEPMLSVLRDRPNVRLTIYPSVPEWIVDALRAEPSLELHLDGVN